MDEEATELVLTALFDIRADVRRLVEELLDDEEDDGSGPEAEA